MVLTLYIMVTKYILYNVIQVSKNILKYKTRIINNFLVFKNLFWNTNFWEYILWRFLYFICSFLSLMYWTHIRYNVHKTLIINMLLPKSVSKMHSILLKILCSFLATSALSHSRVAFAMNTDSNGSLMWPS